MARTRVATLSVGMNFGRWLFSAIRDATPLPMRIRIRIRVLKARAFDLLAVDYPSKIVPTEPIANMADRLRENSLQITALAS
jgi:hypothetical protein